MIRTVFGALALAAVAASAPAAAVTTVTFTYTGASNATGAVGVGLSKTVVIPAGSYTAVANAVRFDTTSALLANISELTAGQTRITANGFGVFGGSANGNIDTNTASREAILLTANKNMQLSGAVLLGIDGNDSLRVFGVNPNTGALDVIGYDGFIQDGLDGAASVSNGGTSTNTLNFTTPSASYKQFVFTTRTDGFTQQAQAYSIGSLTFSVPEPATWGLMIVGFGLVGVAARRRRPVLAA
jgi:hypothetical protein